MTISNYGGQYLKVKSDYIQGVINTPGDYSSIVVTGNINCCLDNSNHEVQYTATIPITTAQWQVDLSTAVGLNSSVQNINVQNIVSLQVYDTLTTPIDLGYVETNCNTESCTLATFSGHFAPLFKTAIDNWFTANSIVSNVTVTFNGNIVIISDIPSGYLLSSMEYGSSAPYTAIFAGTTNTTKSFLGADGLYIAPDLFTLISFIDGIYKLSVKINKSNNSYTLETNCSLIDISLSCKVASVLQNIQAESLRTTVEKPSTVIHLLHYALVNGSNCGCNCDELCTVFRELIVLLNNIDSTLVNSCGC